MPSRQRIIKPDFWIDEKLGLMPEATQLLYIGLWTIADDEGRMQYSLTRFAAVLQPYKKLSEKEMTKRIEPLLKASRVIVYRVGEQLYAWLPKFLIHQTIGHPTASKLPPFEEGSRVVMNPHEQYDVIETNVHQHKSTEGTPRGTSPEKTDYGLGVLLTDDEHAKLVAEFGEALTSKKIEALGLYIDSKGAKYKSHYSTILSWDRRDQAKNGNGHQPEIDPDIAATMRAAERMKERAKEILGHD